MIMGPTWFSYVPDYIARDILAHPDRSPVGRERRIHVVALCADVSGFTPMSEALGQVGKAGAEELTQILNSYFVPMIDLVQSYGGSVAKFVGDAMTIVFPYDRRSRPDTVRRAIQCALDMQREMTRYAAIQTHAGTFSLAMKAGLALGRVFYTTVGDQAIHHEAIIAGRVLDRCGAAEQLAAKGEVVVHNDLLRYVGGVKITERRGDFACMAGMEPRARRQPIAPVGGTLTDAAAAALAAYLHPALASRLREDQSGFINEHRKVTMLFGGYSGFDYDDDPQVGGKLQKYLLEVMRIVERYGGYFSRADMGDKGSRYLVLFGAPIAHEDDEERALRCALELIALPPGPARIGVNTGFVFCGGTGSDRRQEYTVMGDAANLAARLMQATRPRQIIASEVTRSYVNDMFVWRALDPIEVKGKSGKIAIAEPLRVQDASALHRQEPAYALPMVGRAAELGYAEGKIAQVLRGRGQILGITGEAGMGKSRLNAEIVKLAAGHGLVAYGGECQSYGTQMSYLAWRNLWRGFFGIVADRPPKEQLAHLQAQLVAIDPGLVQRMPLLDVVLNITIPQNELTQSLDAKLRKESLEALLLDCLRHRARQGPLLLVLEDCHWIDPLSHDLLELIGRNLSDLPVLMVVLYRPPEAEHGQALRVVHLAHFSEYRLHDFTAAEAEQLIRLKLARHFGVQGDLPPRTIERIREKAQGNPFYIDEMIDLMRDRGIDPHDLPALEQLELPESLHSLIMSRIDQLAEDQKSTLKIASVIGRSFKARWLWNVYPQLGTPEEVASHLDTLSALGLTPLDKAEPEPEYLFKHVVTQEVAYESMAGAMRASLHNQIGDFIERGYAENLDSYVDLLAFHFGRSRNTEKQRTYYRRAGDAARAASANQVTIDYYQRLLPLLMPEERAAALCDLGEVLQLIGKWAEAEESYQQALALTIEEHDQQAQARCQLLLGHLMWYKAAYPDALGWLEQARAGFQRSGDRVGLSQAIGRIGLVYETQDNYQSALASLEQQLEITTELGYKEGLAEVLGHIGYVYQKRSEHSRALEWFGRQSASAAEAGNRRETLHAVGNIGNIYRDTGDYPKALVNLSRALEIAVEIGDRYSVAIAAVNIGEVYRFQGDYAHALISYHYGLDAAIELDHRMVAMVTVENIAHTYVGQGHDQDAERLFDMAIALAEALGIPYYLVADLYGKAELLFAQRRYTEAQAANDEALRVALQVERRDIHLKAQILDIELRVVLGQIDSATAAGECAPLWEVWPAASEHAAIFYELWRLTGLEEHRRQAAELYREQYAHTPNMEYRQRLTNLTGSPPAEPPALPELPEIITQKRVELDALLERVDAMVATESESMSV